MYEEEYKKSIRIIKECKEYAKDIIKDCVKDYDFSMYDHLLLLDDSYYHSHRGQLKSYLIFSKDGLQVTNEYADHYTSTKHIGTYEDKPYTYDYNANVEKTIELACQLATNWNTIKDNMERIVRIHKAKHEQNEKMLSNFSPKSM